MKNIRVIILSMGLFTLVSAQSPNPGDLTCIPPTGDMDEFIWAFEISDT